MELKSQTASVAGAQDFSSAALERKVTNTARGNLWNHGGGRSQTLARLAAGGR